MEEIEGKLSELRDTFKRGKTRNIIWRKSQLRSMIKLIQDNEEKIFKALYQDLGKHRVECYRDEIGVVLKSARYSLDNLDNWVAPKKDRLPLLFFPANAQVIPEPLGVALVFSSWNFPISLALDPIIGAISAGNAVVLKPSEIALACSAFLSETIPLYLDSKAIKVISGGADFAEMLLQQKWDKIFFTGSPRVGRIVMTAAARHLTPVTLELGGKCPTIFDFDTISNTYHLKVAIKRVVGGKWGVCYGQACLGIDYVLVEEKFSSTLIDLLKRTVRKFYGENHTQDICRIVNKRHFDRLRNLLKDPAVAASIVFGGLTDEEKLFIGPTILLNPPLDAEIMNEEIFGPLLPIITLNNIQESIEFINSKPRPLAIYAFTNDEVFKRQIIQGTSSGSVTFNDALVQFLCDQLPFGGVGQSGFGRYHGKYSFDTFSHEKAVLRRGFFPELEPRYPPWNEFKEKFIRLGFNFDYLGLMLLLLGLKK